MPNVGLDAIFRFLLPHLTIHVKSTNTRIMVSKGMVSKSKYWISEKNKGIPVSIFTESVLHINMGDEYSYLPNTTPWVIIRTGVGFPSLGFYYCPWFSLFPTLGYYPALSFLFFPPLATIQPLVLTSSHPWLLFSPWFSTFTHPWLRFLVFLALFITYKLLPAVFNRNSRRLQFNFAVCSFQGYLYLFKLLSAVSDQNARGLSQYIIFDSTVVIKTKNLFNNQSMSILVKACWYTMFLVFLVLSHKMVMFLFSHILLGPHTVGHSTRVFWASRQTKIGF